MRFSKTGRKTSSVASAVWHVAPSCWNQMLPISSSSNCEQRIAIDCNGLSLHIFEEKCPNYGSGPKFEPNNNSFWVRRLFNACLRVFCVPNATILLVYPHTRQDQNELHLKRWFFFFLPKSACSVNRSPIHSVVQAYTQPYSFGGRIKSDMSKVLPFTK